MVNPRDVEDWFANQIVLLAFIEMYGIAPTSEFLNSPFYIGHGRFIGIRIGIKSADPRFEAILGEKIGWGGRIRTFTVLINSEVSYQLDHAPAGCFRPRFIQGRTAISRLGRKKERRSILLRYHDPALGKCPGQKCGEKSLNFFIRQCISIVKMDGCGWTRKWLRIAISSSLARTSFRFKRASGTIV